MRKLIVLGGLMLAARWAMALPNPAALYCERLGYEYQTDAGGRGMAVVAPGVAFDAWAFFKGKVGREYSFAALHGYDIECVREDAGGYTVEYAVCFPRGRPRRAGETGIKLEELMRQKGMPLLESGARARAPRAGASAREDADMLRIYGIMDENLTLPASFDWRNRDGLAYIGPVRDQGNCGSCYSFAACAAAEGTYNWATGKYGSQCADFSESFIIWCLARKPEYNAHFYGCDGADYDYMELEALTVEGVGNESAFPYTEVDPGSCTHWSDPTTVFTSWHRVPCNDVEAIKTAIMTYGVVDAAVDVDGGFSAYSGGVYENSDTTCPDGAYTTTDHAIALVGWDDNPPEGGGGCWILRNSWNTSWGENGYMRIRYTSARVGCSVCYMTYPSSATRTLTVVSAHGGATPPVGDTVYNSGTLITAMVTNSPVLIGTNRHVCTGWTGTGSAPASGHGTNTGAFALSADSSITWRWETNVLAAPAGVSAGAGVSVDKVDVAWQAVATATSYQLWRATANNSSAATLLKSGLTATGYADTGALVGQLYYYWVKAVNAEQTSAFSAYTTGWRAAISSGVAADYDGDGLADPALYGESAGAWRIKPSAYGYVTQMETFRGLGGRGYASVTADYDGDGRADPAVYHELSGAWSVLMSAGGYSTVTTLPRSFGGNGYTGMAADYDGDGLADPAVYHRQTGDWQVLMSGRNYQLAEFAGFLGGAGYWPVAADYDGDGLADPAVYDYQTGAWIIRLSGNGYRPFTPMWTLGGAGYWPVAADYDGDGRADPAVRPASGNVWQARMSSENYTLKSIPLVF